MASNTFRFPTLQEGAEVTDQPEFPSESAFDPASTFESFSWTYASLHDHLERDHDKEEIPMSQLNTLLDDLQTNKGFIAAAVANAESGMALQTIGGRDDFDIDVAAAVNSDVIKSKLQAMDALGLGNGKDHIEDILITLGSQYHLIRPYAKDPSVFIYLSLDKSQANLAMARRSLAKAEAALDF